ncbi:alanine--tRNA ligase-related protein [Lederbergia wuyishanensis]|uniref:Alanyl-tRNA synthetase n=1 Tax=Lederbergia wuyishanensis TaxID=1347903 RepID=A0ABU0D830_9BACI|nr:alanine--tRNA ligase-related protein [Lederbergia wuyishanensis]MCJ8009285.1 alanine--tRNA ligase-related protein [Lederbergia wuyishanensis]MDQ0344581.1 alanyl-tRNA synthetase [Lederbergia wuyishanensis]
MLQDRLYYQDAYIKTFTSRVVKESQDSDGNWYVVLENTAFYPTGGGQPHDTGTINGFEVLNVEEVDGEIRHTVAEKVNSTDDIEGLIDWSRRFDHMQQHTGQHVLTAAFVDLFGFQTESFHLGKELCTIDLAVENLTDQQLEAAEKLANEIILKNLPIETKWVTEDEIGQYSLRKELAVSDEIRLVIIPDFDYNGCGGTHPSTTGQVSGIKILSTEKQKRKVRVHFVCGGRILQQLHRKNAILTEASRQLSSPEDGINSAVEKLLTTNYSLEKSLKETSDVLLKYEAKELLAKKEDGMVKHVFIGRTLQEMQSLARIIVALDDYATALLVLESEDRLQYVAAKGAAVNTSMKSVSDTARSVINGKGGGKDNFVQGGGERTISGEELLKQMAESITV